jgi:hypothetical protein
VRAISPAFLEDADSHSLEGLASRRAIRKEKVSDSLAVADEGTASLDAHAHPAQRFAHFGQCPGPILERNAEVLHREQILRPKDMLTLRWGSK